MDNCSLHENHQSMPILAHVKIYSLSPNATRKLQLLRAGTIASLKMNYRLHHLERAVHISGAGLNDIYNVDILTAMQWLEGTWDDLAEKTIFNCWPKTGILALGLFPVVATSSKETNTDAQIREEIIDTVLTIVPEACRIST